MTTSYCNSFLLKTLSCLIFLQLLIALPVRTQANPKITSFEVTIESGKQLEDLFRLTRQIMKNKFLYKHLNTVFAEQLIITKELQEKYDWPEKTKGLSEPQILFMLHSLPKYQKLLKEYLQKITPDNVEKAENKEFREKMKAEFSAAMKNDTFLEKIKSLNDPENSLTINTKSKKPSFQDVSIHFNHETQPDPRDRSHLTEPEDIKQIVKDFIAGAKHSIIGNFFETNLIDVAEEFIKKNNEGVSIQLGVDKNTVGLSEENKAVDHLLTKQQNLRGKRSTFEFVKVDSAGLNHQKILVRDAGTPDAAVLVLSGNATQSCIGKEGDAINLPKSLRPEESRPNANHVIFMKGEIPAIIAKHELQKTLVERLKGRDEYPISGSYKLANGEVNPKNGRASELVMAFSPNGGMGSINKTLFKPLILESKGHIMMLQFAASSKDLIEALTELGKKQIKNNEKFDFKFVGDPPFSKREWSIPLFMSGLQRDENKIYSENPNFPLKEIEDQIRQQIRINQNRFGEYNPDVTLPDGTTKNVKITVKLHHKVFIFPKIGVAVLGSSFNPSDAAESNQEQVMIFRNHPIIEKAMAGFYFLYYEKGSISLAKAAERSNLRKDKEIERKDLESDTFKKQSERAKKQSPEARSFRALSCPAVFAN